MWFMVDPKADRHWVMFHCVGTGMCAKYAGKYLDTFQSGMQVHHLFTRDPDMMHVRGEQA